MMGQGDGDLGTGWGRGTRDVAPGDARTFGDTCTEGRRNVPGSQGTRSGWAEGGGHLGAPGDIGVPGR